MSEPDTTNLFEPLDADDVIQMHGADWIIRKRCSVCIEAITDPAGTDVNSENWRSNYEGAVGDAIFASRIEAQGERWVVQVRHLMYINSTGQTVTTNDLLRTSSGILEQDGENLIFTSRRTRYIFKELISED
ncbi:MAG: hypothetical protein IKE43_08335 [Coriobacteriales bacterium]|nr:hypothetical protein [Coriobacteriales bacterium]